MFTCSPSSKGLRLTLSRQPLTASSTSHCLKQHPRDVLVAAVLVDAQRTTADLLAVDLVEDVEVLLGRAAVGVALDRPLPAEGFFLAPPPASPRVLLLTLCFLNAAPRL